jgi:hypothetical protein
MTYICRISFCRNHGTVYMRHHTRRRIPTDRNHVTAMIIESNLMCAEKYDRTGGSCKKKQLTGRYVVVEGHSIY